MRATTAKAWLRAAPLGVLCCFSLGLWAWLPLPPAQLALPFLNVTLPLLAGALFGLRGGLGGAAGLGAGNLALLALGGSLGDPAALWGSALSLAAGALAGALVGKARDLALALRLEVDRLQQVERQKEELTTLLVHDLKNPLAAILGHSALLQQEGMTAEDVKDSAESIFHSAERLKQMVLNLLDINRGEDGQLRPQLTLVNLNELAREVAQAMERQFADRRQRVEMRLAADGNVRADSELVRRLLTNLMDNASKYMPAEKTIRLEMESGPDAVVLGVADEGPGIPAGYEQRIFDKYVRLDRTAETDAGTSRGLGLAFCRLAAEVHGGKIWVEPHRPQGSVFRVRLPRQGPVVPPPPASG